MYYGLGYGMDWTYILVLIGAVICLVSSSKVKSTFAKYSKVRASSGYTGAQVAQMILEKEGIYDVTVGHVSGELTDHFNPATKVVNLSDSVYSSTSVAAIGVAAHECGHAMQHNEEYGPLKVRSAIVPVANFGSKIGIPLIIAGALVPFIHVLVPIGVILFSASVAFQLVTLPVEFDASRRALEIIKDMNIVTPGAEHDAAKQVLKSAAMTYVASAAAAILSLIRLLLIFGGSRGRRRD